MNGRCHPKTFGAKHLGNHALAGLLSYEIRAKCGSMYELQWLDSCDKYRILLVNLHMYLADRYRSPTP